MNPADHWDRIQELFLTVADLPPGERARFLDQCCEGSHGLRDEVESLLASDDKCGSGIVSAIEREAQALLGIGGLVGTRLDAYLITGEIGRGGMGTVYRASRDDNQYHQRVAIKVIRHGMDTEDVLDRFRSERQILANLDHPFIARLLDGGTAPDGRPYFVMEYVEGQPLDAYCRDRALDLRSRCELFVKICEAVSHAHHNLVAHRDLKPGNILITADGAPKLLDFGVAKLLDPETGSGQTQTIFTQHRLTPDYASPEQFRSGLITTATDIYSLGAILYELLCGRRPHRFANRSMPELERVICEIDPPKPSAATPALRRDLEGDLDAIVGRAMRKEPELRYPSVEQLAADVRNYLDGWPVVARHGDVVYRADRYLRRNRTAIAVGAMFTIALIGGAATATVQAIKASREQARAERERVSALASQARAEASQRESEVQAREAQRQRGNAELERVMAETQRQLADHRFEQVRQLAGKFLLDFHDSIASLPGSTAARKMVVETGLEYYDTLVREAGGNRTILEEVARGYDRLGDVQGNPYLANLGDAPGAVRSYRKAMALREKIDDPSAEFLRDRILGHVRIGQLLTVQGDFAGAARYLNEGLALASHGPNAQAYVVRDALSRVYSSYGDLKIRQGVHGEAVEPYLNLLELSAQLAKETKDRAEAQRGISLAHTKLGDVYGRLERHAEALEHLRVALEIDTRLAAANPNSIPFTRKLYVDDSMIGRVLRSRTGQQLGKPGEAKTYLESAAVLADKMAALDTLNNQTLMDVLMARSGLGDWLRQSKETGAAIAAYRSALNAAERMKALGPMTSSTADALVQAHQRLATGLADAGQFDEALQHLRSSEEYVAVLDRQNSGMTRNSVRRAEIQSGRAGIFMSQNKWRDAIAAFGSVIDIFSEQRKRDPKNETFLNEQPALYAGQADCYAELKQWPSAVSAMQTALTRLGEIESHRPLVKDEVLERTTGLAKLAQWEQR